MTPNRTTLLGQFASKVFNIAPHELPRVLFAWSLRFFFMIGYTVGWTLLTAMLVSRIGISYLPILYISNALLVIVGAMFFGELLHRFSKTKLIYSSVAIGAILLATAIAVFYSFGNWWLFFGILLVAESIFFAQLNILLGLFIEDLFTPLESGRAFPLIETSEYIGGIAGGLAIVGGLRLHFETNQLAWIWVGAVALILPAILLFNKFRQKLPTLEVAEKKTQLSHFAKFREGKKQIRQTPFLTGLVFVVLLQWTLFTLLNFQYTKAVDANNSHSSEIATEESHAAADSGHSHEELLTHGLGSLHILFYSLALLTQLFLSSRIISKFGIVKTLRLHPLATFGSSCLLLLRPGFGSAVFAKGLFESTSGVYTAAYHSSFYALREKIRGNVKEFLEGLIRPAGVLVGTGILIIGEKFLSGDNFSLAINFALVAAAAAMSFLLWRNQKNYTKIPEANLRLAGNDPAKFQSIEILAQSGHDDAAEILVQKLFEKNESSLFRGKILETLGTLADPHAVSTILKCFHDTDENVRLSAVRALVKFDQLDKKEHAFTHRRAIECLKELFARESSPEIRSTIVHVFANLRKEEAVEFLVAELQNPESPIRGDCIFVCGQFGDLGISHYIEPYLRSPNPIVRANSIVALWQFKQFRLRLTRLLTELLDATDREIQKITIHTLGEIRANHELPRLLDLLECEDNELRLLAALALAKLENPIATHPLVEFILHPNLELAAHAKKQIQNLPKKIRKTIEKILHHRLSEKLNGLLATTHHRQIERISNDTLNRIRRIYELADDWEEVAKLDTALVEKISIN